MIKDSEFDTWYSQHKPGGQKGRAFPCLRCGVCCSKYQALLNLQELQQLADGLAISCEEFKDKYTDHRWGGTESFLLRHQDGACIFLAREENSRLTYCSINSFKPSDCLAWSPDPDKPECREGLKNQNNLK